MISVIMPLYNNEKYVIEAIKSVINQTYKDWELIIINDASTDNSKFVVQNFLEKEKDNRLIFIDLKENKGVSFARNLGMRKAKGEYISFLDSDDFWDKSFLDELYKRIKETNCKFCFSLYAYIYNDKDIINCKTKLNEGNLIEYIYMNKSRWEMLFPFHIGSILIDNKFLKTSQIIFPEDQILFEDALFISKLLCITNAIAVNKILMYYRQQDKSAFHKDFLPEEYNQELIFFYRLKKYAEKNDLLNIYKLENVIIYRTYRVILSIIKSGYINEGLEYINLYEKFLKEFIKRKYHRINDRIKCRIFLLKNKKLLNLLKNI